MMLKITLPNPTQQAIDAVEYPELNGDRVREVFLCPACGEEHDDEDDARDCCGISRRYICNVCGKKYGVEDDAADCCPSVEVESNTIPVTACRVCGKNHADYTERNLKRLATLEEVTAAVECCLWRTMSYAEREELARQMYTYQNNIENGTV